MNARASNTVPPPPPPPDRKPEPLPKTPADPEKGSVPPVTRLNATRLPSGDSDGHSTLSARVVRVRERMSPRTSAVVPAVFMPTVA